MEEGKDPGEDGKEETKKRRKFEGAKEEKKPKKASKRDCKRKTSHEKELKDDEPQEAKNKKKQKVKRNGKKQKKRAPAPEAPAEPAEPAEAEPSANVPQNPPRDDDVVQSDVLPNSKSLRLGVLLFSMKEMHKQGLEDDEAFERMKENLPDLKACRMNIYWSRAAVGLTCRAEKKDFAYFRQGCKGCPNVIRLVAMLKAAEMVVACRHSIFLWCVCAPYSSQHMCWSCNIWKSLLAQSSSYMHMEKYDKVQHHPV